MTPRPEPTVSPKPDPMEVALRILEDRIRDHKAAVVRANESMQRRETTDGRRTG